MNLTIHEERRSVAGAFSFAQEVHELGLAVPDGGTGALWFRGQADADWELKPSIGRPVDANGLYEPGGDEQDFYKRERVLIQRFKRDSYPFVQRTLTDWEAITLGQHHMLSTRLLDWTSNPLVALFFAAEKQPERPGRIFAYRPRRDHRKQISMFEGQNPVNPRVIEPLDVKGIKIVYPMLIVDRLITQSGGFTIQDPLKCLLKRDVENFDTADLDVLEIYTWQISQHEKPNILRELHRVSINRRTLYPGLDSVGEGLRLQEQYRQPHPIY